MPPDPNPNPNPNPNPQHSSHAAKRGRPLEAVPRWLRVLVNVHDGVSYLGNKRTQQVGERVTGGQWRRIVLGDLLAEHVVQLRGSPRLWLFG